MFEVSLSDADRILKDYGIKRRTVRLTELERLCYEKNDPASKEVRLIVKAELSDNESVVVRFRNENNVSPKLIEKQCQFAELLKQNGIETPALYRGRKWNENSLLKELERKNTDGVRKWLKEIHKRINLRRELYENTDQR